MDTLKTRVLMSAERALSGAITPGLRAVTVDYDNDLMIMRAYFDDGSNENDKELIDVALAETAADLWQDIREFRYEPVNKPFPEKMEKLKEWIYQRDGES